MANQFLFANFVAAELVASCKATDTVLQINPQAAAALPGVGASQQIALTLWDGTLPPEIVYCTTNNHSGSITVVRAQENTTAQAWAQGSQVKCTITAAVINQALNAFYNISSIISAQFLPLSGGTLTGPLTLAADPTLSLQAATKEYVDNSASSGLPLTGGTMLGPINMNGQRIINLPTPVSATEAATKAYADGALSNITSANNTYTGDNVFNGFSTFNGQVVFTNTVTNTGSWTFQGPQPVNFFNGISVTGLGTFNSGVNVTGNSTFNSLVTFAPAGAVHFNGPILSTGNNTWSGANTFTGGVSLTSGGISIVGGATLDSLTVTPGATTVGNLTVNGAETLNGALVVSGNITTGTSSTVMLNGPLGVTGNTDFAGSSNIMQGAIQFTGAGSSFACAIPAQFSGPWASSGAGPQFQNTDSLLLPVGTSAQRGTGIRGQIRWNTSFNFPEFFDGANWTAIGNIVVNPVLITGNTTYNPTTTMLFAEVIAVGGGGAGGGSQTTSSSQLSVGGGGAAGGIAAGIFSASVIGSSITVTVGAGGSGVSGATGNNGGQTIFGGLMSANGGGGGGSNISGTVAAGASPLGGTASGGNLYNLTGNRGQAGWLLSSGTNNIAIGGAGGAGFEGTGGGPASACATAGAVVSPGVLATGFGAGGGGSAALVSQSATAGGSGTGGAVIIKEYNLVI